MRKFSLVGLALAAGLSSTPLLAAESSHNSADIRVEGDNITTEVQMIGTNADLVLNAHGGNQRNHVFVGTCPAGTKLEPADFHRAGLNLAVLGCK